MDPKAFFNTLCSRDFNRFFGVPDSLLSSLCAYIDDNAISGHHVICANEGNAIAMAAGHYLGTRNAAVVYMQNSGLGNAINPLVSIAHSEVYQIPMLLIIGWRGEPGSKDEPQHVKQGQITPDQLDLLNIPYITVDKSDDPDDVINWAQDKLVANSSPVALLVKKGCFDPYKTHKKALTLSSMTREMALNEILTLVDGCSIISTTGKTSREVFELRAKRGEQQRDFLMVGGMGHTSSVALGLLLGRPDLKVVCIDGDGSTLMHMGALPIIGSLPATNFIHVILNNSAHESVGGQPTVAGQLDFRSISTSCGYRQFYSVSSLNELNECWSLLSNTVGPIMIEVKITIGSRSDLGRPTSTPIENKLNFINWNFSKLPD